MTGPVLVIGASGKLGREVVRQLQAAGYTTRCATRNPDRHPDLGDHRVRFDWNSPLTFEPALDGVSRVFLTARPLDIAAAAVVPGFIDECRTAAVEHVVFSSALGADVFKAGPLALVVPGRGNGIDERGVTARLGDHRVSIRKPDERSLPFGSLRVSRFRGGFTAVGIMKLEMKRKESVVQV